MLIKLFLLFSWLYTFANCEVKASSCPANNKEIKEAQKHNTTQLVICGFKLFLSASGEYEGTFPPRLASLTHHSLFSLRGIWLVHRKTPSQALLPLAWGRLTTRPVTHSRAGEELWPPAWRIEAKWLLGGTSSFPVQGQSPQPHFDDLILVPSLPSLLSPPAPCMVRGDRKLRVTWYKTTFGIPNIQIISLFPLGE